MGFEPDLLLFNRVMQVLVSGLGDGTDPVGVVVVGRLCDLLCLDGLFFVVKETDTLLLHHPLDGLLNLTVVQCQVNVLRVPLANLFTQFFVELHADFFHDF